MVHFNNVPTSLTLARAEEDEVMRLIADAGLDPAEFTWAVRPSLYAPTELLIPALIHTPTDSSFRFDFLEMSVFKPGDCYGQEQIRATGSWGDQVREVRQWLSRLFNAKR
jgi:hypothetical protein